MTFTKGILLIGLLGTAGLLAQPSPSENGYDRRHYEPLVYIEEPSLIGGYEAILEAFVYPEEARANMIEGVLVMECVIDIDGNPKDAQAILGPRELMRAAEDAVEKSRWIPSKLDGEPVSVRVQFELDIRLSDTAQRSTMKLEHPSGHWLTKILFWSIAYGLLYLLQSSG